MSFISMNSRRWRAGLIVLGLLFCCYGFAQAQNIGNSFCPQSLGNGWTANKCVLADGTTTFTATISPTATHGVLVLAYLCAVSPCTATPPSTFSIGDNINTPETCLTNNPSPHSPGLESSGGAKVRAYWWYCPSIPSGVTSFTITSSTFGAVWVVDVSGGQTSGNAFDEDGFTASSSSGTSASVSTSTNTTNANDLICGVIDNDNEEAQTIGSGFTALLNDGSGGTGNGVFQCKSVTATGTYPVTATWTGSDTWEGYTMALKSSSAGSPSSGFDKRKKLQRLGVL